MVQIREATLADIDEVWVIEKDSFTDTWSKESFIDLIENKNAKFIIAAIEEKVVGYSVIYLLGDQADVANIAVSSLYRRNSIAEKLMAEILAYAKLSRVQEVFLEVRESNNPAIGLYKKLSFDIIGKRRGYYRKPKEDALIMKLEI